MFLSFYSDAVVAADGQALGPFDDIVIRAARIVGGPLGSGRVIAFRGSDGRWLEAEREALRGVASDAPFARHSHLRLHSTGHDLMVRFFAEDQDDAPVEKGSEIGPYFAITIGPRELRGDGELLADRASPSIPWVARQAPDPHRRTVAGAVLAVRSGSVAHAGEDARVAVAKVAVADVAVTKAAEANISVTAPAAMAPTPVPPSPVPAFSSEFRFIERVRVSPRIYIARGTAAERDP